jgi:hypothetical protein
MTRYSDKFIPDRPELLVKKEYKEAILAYLYKIKVEADCLHTYALVNCPNSEMSKAINTFRYEVTKCVESASQIETKTEK